MQFINSTVSPHAVGRGDVGGASSSLVRPHPLASTPCSFGHEIAESPSIPYT